MGRWMCLLLAAFLALPAHAEEGRDARLPPGPERAAEGFVKAWRAKDAAAMAQVAVGGRVDPVLTAHALLVGKAGSESEASVTDRDALLAAFVEAGRAGRTARPLAVYAERWANLTEDDRGRERRLFTLSRQTARAVWRFMRGAKETVALFDEHQKELMAAKEVSPAAVQVLVHATRALTWVGRNKEAVRVGRAAAKAAADVHWNRVAAQALSEVSEGEEGLGRGGASAEALEESLVFLERLDHAHGLLETRCRLARKLSRLRRFDEALRHVRAAYANAHRLSQAGRVSSVQMTEAFIHKALGNLGAAIALYEAALVGMAGTPFDSSRGRCSIEYGNALRLTGRHAGALDAFDEALAHPSVQRLRILRARALVGLANTYMRLGLHDQALSFGRQALTAIREEKSPGGELANTHYHLAYILARLGHHDEAESSLRVALQRFTAEERDGAVAAARLELARVEIARNNLDAADEHVAAAEAIFRDVGMAIGVLLARAMAGHVAERRGDLAEAVRIHAEALDRMRALDARAHGRVSAQAVLARVQLLAGRAGDAAGNARAAAEAFLDLSGGLSETEALGLRRDAGAVTAIGLTSAHRMLAASPAARDRWIAEAAWHMEAGRSVLLAGAVVNAQALIGEIAPPDLREKEALARARAKDAQKALLAAAADPEVEAPVALAARAALDKAYAELETASSRVVRAALEKQPWLRSEPLSLEAIRSGLGAGDAFVSYAQGWGSTYALVVTDAGADLLDLGATDALEAQIGRYLEVVSVRGGADQAPAAALYDRLLRPLEAVIGSRTRLRVAPVGAIAFLPLASLMRRSDGKAERAVERWEITFVPSGTVEAALREKHGQARGARGVIALGDPVYPGEVSETDTPVLASMQSALGGLPRLPSSGKEAADLVSLFPEKERHLLLRENATMADLEKALAARRDDRPYHVLHLGCHGFLDSQRPRLSGLVLTGGEVLSVESLYAMRIPAELAVLSACETGRGTSYRGEGVIGLTRGFLYAGVPRVIVSSWKVEDESTRRLMKTFYGALVNEGLSASAALRKAQLAMLRGGARAHPFHWAGFVPWGLADR